jgi:hypothetical protein
MAEKSSAPSMRALMRQQLPPEEIVPQMVASIKEALAATKTDWFECSHCHKKSALVFPALYERVKAAQLVMSEIEGKVGTHREAPAVQKSVTGDFSEMSDEQLIALLGGPVEDDDGETDGGAEEEASF